MILAIVRGKSSRNKIKTCFKLFANAIFNASSAIIDSFDMSRNFMVSIEMVRHVAVLIPGSKTFVKVTLRSSEAFSGSSTQLQRSRRSSGIACK